LLELEAHDRDVANDATLAGRSLEPWRAILAVAHWLDDKGMDGLWDRMNRVSVAYQKERPELETSDYTALTIRALCAKCANLANCANQTDRSGGFEVTSADVAKEALGIIGNEDIGINPEKITAQRVGMVFNQLRLQKPPRSGGKGARRWRITLSELKRYTAAYGLVLPDELSQFLDAPSQVGSVGPVGPVGTVDEGTGPDTSVPQSGASIPFGKAQIDTTRLQELIDAGVPLAEAKEKARTDYDPSGDLWEGEL
jgi:hypothetical protein